MNQTGDFTCLDVSGTEYLAEIQEKSMRFLFAFASVAFAMPLAAQEPMPEPAKPYATMSLSELGDELGKLEPDDPACTVKFPLYREAAKRRPDILEIVGAAKHTEIVCADDREQYDLANRLLLDWEADGGGVNENYAMFLAAAAKDGKLSFKRLQTSLREGDAESYGSLLERIVWMAAREARSAGFDHEVDTLFSEIVKAGEMDSFPKELRGTIADGALDVAAKENDIERAESMLAFVNSPTSYDRLLGQRDYDSLWPAIERRVGPNYRTITTAYREEKLAEWRAEPENLELYKDAVHAVYYDGDWEAVIALADEGITRADPYPELVEDEGWALNLKAYALDALGRQAEADAIFEGFTAIDPEANGWIVNFVINRGSRLVGQGRWEEGLAAMQLASKAKGSTYAEMLVALYHVCALQGLGRVDEMTPHLAFLDNNKDEHPGLTARGLQCIERNDEAAELLLIALRDETLRDRVLDDLQPVEFDLFYTRSILLKPRDLLASHPELREEFLKHARIIPDEFYPVASLKR